MCSSDLTCQKPDPEEGIGEVSCSKRACCCRGLVQLVSEELLEKKMATDSHIRDCRDCRGSERGHNRRVREDAKENGMRKKLTDEEYWKEIAEIIEQFNKVELMINESQRVGWLMKKKVKWQRLQMKREQMINAPLKERLIRMIEYFEKDLKTETSSEA